MELLSLSEWKLIILLQGVTNPGEINYCFKNNYQNSVAILAQGDVLHGRFSLIGTAMSYDCFGISPHALMGTLLCPGFLGIP